MNAYLDDIPRATGKRSLSVEIHKPGAVRLRDKDNLVASLKHLIDSMVNMKLLVDDSPQWLDLKDPIERNGMNGYKTIVRLGDV